MPSYCDQDNLQEIGTSNRTRGYYKRNRFLTMTEIYNYLSYLSNQKVLKSAGKTMKKNIDNVGSDDFLQVPIEFPVLALQHVTSHEQVKKILESRSFKGTEHERPEFKDLSFWGADLSSDDIEKVRLQVYETMRMMVRPEDMETFHEEIKEQFANSPAFNKSASCYGNFKFSFPLSLLLSRYKTQHCNGKEPQLRILGTDIYKQEIAHYIVVHGPGTKDFDDLQEIAHYIEVHSPGTKDFDDLHNVPDTLTNSNDHVVCWMNKTLYWRPKSTSSSLHLKISKDSCTHRISESKKKRKKTGPRRKMRPDVASCVWNHLVLAFHIPKGKELNIPVQQLLRNLTPCHALQPFLRSDPIQKHQARELIRTLHERFSPNSRRHHSQPGKTTKHLTPYEMEITCLKRIKEMKKTAEKKSAGFRS